MEVQLAVKDGKPTGRSGTPPHRGGGAAVPGYLRPSPGSCHHVCKYGGAHTFQESEAHRAQQVKPRKQPPVPDSQKRTLVRVRLVPRKLFGGFGRGDKVAKPAAGNPESVEWKDIAAYDTVPAHESPAQVDKISAQVTGSGGIKKKDVVKGKKSYDKAKISEQVGGVKDQNEPMDKKLVKSVGSKNTSKVSMEPTYKNTETKSVRPPKVKKPTALAVKKMALDQELVDGYQPISPSLLQNRASLLHDLEEEMVHEATDVKEGETTYSLEQEVSAAAAAAAAETSRPIPAHRRVKSMSISSRSVRFPFTRQASKNSAAFKLRSKSSKGPILPSEEEKPARLGSRRGGPVAAGEDSSSTGRGIQLRIRSLRRRGVGGAGTGFVVPSVALRHQKTLEKKRSQRLYNNLIEETASKLVKTRKSRVKSLVGAFESVISKIAK